MPTGINSAYCGGMTSDEILILAQAYAAHSGRTLSGVGAMSCGNAKVFTRLAQGRGANITTVERAYRWFEANWPKDAPWPLAAADKIIPPAINRRNKRGVTERNCQTA